MAHCLDKKVDAELRGLPGNNVSVVIYCHPIQFLIPLDSILFLPTLSPFRYAVIVMASFLSGHL